MGDGSGTSAPNRAKVPGARALRKALLVRGKLAWRGAVGRLH